MSFSEHFVWGVASSAYQTEGACFENGKGASIWDTFSHRTGADISDSNGDIACDAYHLYEKDISLMASLGVRAYRFSVSWPRVDPQGDGDWNEEGLNYYDRVVDCCISHGIEPYVTLYHWDLPQELESVGGWLARGTADAFAKYCCKVAARFGGRVNNYFTLNEIQCVVSLGYESGIHAPGRKCTPEELFCVHHNLLLAHGLAFRAIREVNPAALIGIASTGRLCYPSTQTKEDLKAANDATFETSDDDWMFTHQMVMDPICLGRYPDCSGTVLQKLINDVSAEDMTVIHTDVDCLALNIYNGSKVRSDDKGRPVYVPKPDGCPRTALKWPITPEIMEYGPRFLWERYGRPVLITENGSSCNDFIYLDGKVHDGDRIDFLTRYLRALQRCAESGVPIDGYFHWAFTDNFEWNNGYGERLGLVYVDYETQERILKDSAKWYSSVIRLNGV